MNKLNNFHRCVLNLRKQKYTLRVTSEYSEIVIYVSTHFKCVNNSYNMFASCGEIAMS